MYIQNYFMKLYFVIATVSCSLGGFTHHKTSTQIQILVIGI